MKCVTCSITHVLLIVNQQEIQAHCTNSGDCTRTDIRDSTKTWKTSELHARKDDDGNYDWSHIDTQTEGTSDDEEKFQIEPIERSSKREVQDYVVVEVCGIEPKGSQYRVKWENYDNKKRGEVLKPENVLNCSQLITKYLLSASGITRMNTIKKMFHAAASVKHTKVQTHKFVFIQELGRTNEKQRTATQVHTSRSIVATTSVWSQNTRQFK